MPFIHRPVDITERFRAGVLLNTAYIFGTLGNLAAGSLGSGWSIEEAFAWTVGSESGLTLPLPGDDLAYVVRCDINPAVYPNSAPRQRLTVRCGDVILGSFELTERTTISIVLPVELTRGAPSIHLTLLHPDAVRPCDHGRGGDSRPLALCFASAALLEAGSDAFAADRQAVHGIIAGGLTAGRIAEVIGKLPSLRGRLSVRFMDLSQFATKGVAMASARFCWLEINAGTVAERDTFRNHLPARCTLLTFHAPTLHALWPFLAHDDRAVPEPGRYIPSRYKFGDRHARLLANMNMPDDVVYLMYEMAADQDPIDLDAILAADMQRCRTYDRKTDMKLADFIESRIGSDRVFMAPDHAGPVLLRAMVDQVLGRLPPETGADPDVLSAELDFLLDGYAGWRNELPVHKRVADHFGLAWWSPEFRYCWQNNKRTYREQVLDSVGWVQWRP
jgi:hypothetical protein